MKLFFAVLCLALGSSSFASASLQLKGSRWLAESTGTTLDRLSDLSFPDWAGSYWIGHVEDSRTSKQASDAIDQAREAVFSNDLDADPVVNKKDLRKLRKGFPLVTSKADSDAYFKDGWWHAVDWKNKNKDQVDSPEEFGIADINLPKTYSSDALNFVNSLRFKRNTVGGYEIYWDAGTKLVKTPAKPMINFHQLKSGMKEAITWDGIAEGVGLLLSAIPEPITQAIVKTASSRFFHFHSLVVRSHFEMLLEAVADESNPLQLTTAQQNNAITSLMYSDTSLLMSWRWIWDTATGKWNKRVKKEQAYESMSQAFLDQNQIKTKGLSDAFVFNSDHWFTLGSDLYNKRSGPVVLIDFLQPKAIVNRRMGYEFASTAVSFSCNFIPVVGGALGGLYEGLVESREDRRRVWEARLMSELENSNVAGAQVDLNILSEQRFNPLMPSQDAYAKLIAERKSALHL